MYSDSQQYSRIPSYAPSRKDKEERAKWVDRNNHFYDCISKESSVKSDGPCWLERGFIDSGDESVRYEMQFNRYFLKGLIEKIIFNLFILLAQFIFIYTWSKYTNRSKSSR